MASIPRIPTPGRFSGKDWSATGPGKGSRPRNVSEQFRSNYDGIRFPARKKSKTGFSRTIYK